MSNLILPATITLASVTVGNLIPQVNLNNPTGGYSADSVVRPVGATLLAFGILSAVSGSAPKLVNVLAWTIAGTASLTLALPVITKYFPGGKP